MESQNSMTNAFTFGKFNQIHNGHVALLEQALETHSVVYVGISTAAKNRPVEERIRAFQEVSRIKGWTGRVRFVLNDNMWKAYESVQEPCDIVLGEDRERTGVRLAAERNTQYIKVKRLTSSTEVRRRIAAGEDLSDIVPASVIPLLKVG
jgi:cytidyltransferase-like protein